MPLVNPNFFLVGTTKGGTSSLDLWLRQHPEVGTPRRKEMHFFCECPNPKLKGASTMEQYRAAFPKATAVGESSPCYLYYPDTPKELAQFPEARIIVSLRDPVERFWSHYLMNEVYRPTGRPAEAILADNLAQGRTNALEDLFGVGLYAEQVSRYREVFDDAMAVLFLEEISADPGGVVAELISFLGLGPIELDTSERDKEFVEPRGPISQFLLRNPTSRAVANLIVPAAVRRRLKTRVLGDPARRPPVPGDLAQRLRKLYRADSRALESLLGRPLPWDWHR